MPSSSTDAEPDTPRREVRVLGLLGAGYFLKGFYLLALPPVFPLLKAEFAVGYAALGVVMTAFGLASGLARIPVGFLVDKVGARWFLMIGLAVMAGAVTLIGVSSSYGGLLLLAIVAGVGNSVFQPADYAILSSTVDGRRLGRAFSFHSFAGNLGIMFAPATMVLLTGWWSWRAAVIIVGGFGFLIMLAMLLNSDLLQSDVAARTKTASRPTSCAVPKEGFMDLLSAPILLFLLFFGVASMAATGFRTFSVAAMVALHQTPLAIANAALTGFYLATALGVLGGGMIADRTGRHDLVVAAAVVLGAVMILLMGTLSLPVVSLLGALGIAGLMHGVIRPPRDLMLRTATPRGSIGKVFGLAFTGANFGGAVAPVFFGWLIDQGGPQWVFWLIALLMLLTVAMILAVKRSLNGVRRRGRASRWRSRSSGR